MILKINISWGYEFLKFDFFWSKFKYHDSNAKTGRNTTKYLLFFKL